MTNDEVERKYNEINLEDMANIEEMAQPQPNANGNANPPPTPAEGTQGGGNSPEEDNQTGNNTLQRIQQNHPNLVYLALLQQIIDKLCLREVTKKGWVSESDISIVVENQETEEKNQINIENISNSEEQDNKMQISRRHSDGSFIYSYPEKMKINCGSNAESENSAASSTQSYLNLDASSCQARLSTEIEAPPSRLSCNLDDLPGTSSAQYGSVSESSVEVLAKITSADCTQSGSETSHDVEFLSKVVSSSVVKALENSSCVVADKSSESSAYEREPSTSGSEYFDEPSESCTEMESAQSSSKEFIEKTAEIAK